MKKKKSHELRKIIVFSTLALALAVTAFIGSNNLVFAAATKPETIPMSDAIKISQMSTSTASDDYQTPKLTVVWNDNDGLPENAPHAGAMGYEEAAQIGAQYIWDMYGESIDGKTVEMTYAAWPFSSRTYWMGVVAGSYEFKVDAVTGEAISILSASSQPTKVGSGTEKTVTIAQFKAMQEEPPARLAEFSEIAKGFAQKHFSRTKVASVDFVHVDYGVNRKSFGQNNSDTFIVYDEGISITFNVADDTGRVAFVIIDTRTGQAVHLDTMESDFIPGYIPDEGYADGV
jgi:predicted small secreted protein